MKTTSFGSGDVKGGLEFCIEDVEEAVSEAPKKEEYGDEDDGENRLFDC